MNCNLCLLCHINGQMCMCTCLHHPLKLLTSAVFLLCTDSSQPGWFHVETYMLICMFLGCDLLMQMLLAAKIITKHIIMMIDW